MAKRLRKTKQKELILNEINRFKTMFTADELYGMVKKNNSDISITTVYRLLKGLRTKKELHSYLCDRRIVYSKERNNHCHFSCQKCGKIKHFDVKTIDFLNEEIKGNICHFQIDVNGICEDCLKRTQLSQ